MRIVLSRKGLDSSFGGFPSAILPDGRIVFVPIPGDSDEIAYSSVKTGYSDFDDMYQILSDVASSIRYNGTKNALAPVTPCHLDPDLTKESLVRKDGWKGCFGQADAAQTVLANAGIGEEDLFLFFGWYQFTHYVDGRLRFERGDGFHMIYGYMQIEKAIHTAKEEQIPDWLLYHPHMLERRKHRSTNCIYVGRDTCEWNHSIAGYGIFPQFHPDLVLTAPGMSRSCWKLPEEFRNLQITYHDPVRSWKDGYFQSACRGQEFVFEENPCVETWASALITAHARKLIHK